MTRGSRGSGLLPALVAASLAIAVPACDRGGDPARSQGSMVVMAVPNVEAVKPLDFLVFLPLVRLNEEGELEGRLARSWEHSPDHWEYTFHLRTDIRWHDGVPVTAHDVKFSLDLLTHPDVAELGAIEATVVNDSTVRIRAEDPRWFYIITYFPRHVLAGLEPRRFWEWEFWTRPVGNGPYRFVRYVPETMMEFEANPDYYAGKPRIERVILKFVGDAGLTELLAGNVDIASCLYTQIPRIEADPRFRLYRSDPPGGYVHAVYWKADHALFSDPRVRRALTLAMDRRALLQILNLPQDLPITDGVFTDRQLRRGEWPSPLPYDPDEARALLEAAEWRDRDGDGIRERDGRTFEFTATVSSGPAMTALAVFIQAQLRRVGVQMHIQHFEGSMWQKLSAGDFEAWIHFHQPGAGALRRDFGRGNSLGYRNNEAFALVDRLTATADPEQHDRIYTRLTEVFRTDQPFTRLFTAPRTWCVHRRISGLNTPGRDLLDYMEELWLEDEELK